MIGSVRRSVITLGLGLLLPAGFVAAGTPAQAEALFGIAEPRIQQVSVDSVRNLEAAIDMAARESADGHAIVEPDLRAHCNRERRRVLTRLGTRLAKRLATPCPECGCPGYGRTTSVRGLLCVRAGRRIRCGATAATRT